MRTRDVVLICLGVCFCLGLVGCFTTAYLAGKAVVSTVEIMEEAEQDYESRKRQKINQQRAAEEAQQKAAKKAEEERVLAIAMAEEAERQRLAAAAKAKADAANLKSVEFLKKRVAQGSISAAYKLGIRYLEGDGVETNKTEAIRLLKLAAAEGDKKAVEKLKEVE